MTKSFSAAEQAISLVACSDDNYAPHLCVMLRSALDNLGPGRTFRAFVIDGGMQAKWRERIAAMAAERGCSARFLTPSTEALDALPTFGYINKSAYLRLLLPEALPPEVARAIYLDCDLVVLGDLGRLWDFDLAGRPLGAVPDEGAESTLAGRKHKRQLGMAWDAPYLNSGVLLIDVEKARSERLFSAGLDFVTRNPDRIQWADQDALNVAFEGRAALLPVEWNVQPCHFRCYLEDKRRQPSYPAKAAPPAAVHYCERRKPWSALLNHPFGQEYARYLKRLPWASEHRLSWSLADRLEWRMKRLASRAGFRWVVENLELAYEFQIGGFVGSGKGKRRLKYLLCLVYFPMRANLRFWTRAYCYYRTRQAAPGARRSWRLGALKRLTALCAPKWLVHSWDNAVRAPRVPCDCCGSHVFPADQAGEFAICPVCAWEPDAAAGADPQLPSAANGVSLSEARANYKRLGACSRSFAQLARKPTALERCAQTLAEAAPPERSLANNSTVR